MAKIVLSDLVSSQNETSKIASINNNNALLEAAVENSLSRDGTYPNSMGADLDMGGWTVYNLRPPIADTDAVRKMDLDAIKIPADFQVLVQAAIDASPAAQAAAELAEYWAGIAEAAAGFDASQYYTKTETNTLLTSYLTNSVASSTYVALAQLGTGANKIPQFNASGEYPAASGVNITNINAVSVASHTVGTASEYRSNTSNRLLSANSVWSSAAIVALTDGATIAIDMSTGFNFSVTLAGNRAISNPTNPKVGQSGVILISQDATGSRTLSWGSYFKWSGGTAIVLSTAANSVDCISYFVKSSTEIYLFVSKDMK